ncbi:MAG: type II toxin-antitoxin system VapC family toxin [Nocardioides sp.]
MTYLLDTHVVSEIRKARADPGVVAWFDTVTATELYLSVLVVGELQQGIDRLAARDPAQSRALAAWLDGLRSHFAARIVPVSIDVALTWGRLNAERPLPAVDGLLAATALAHGWTLVTRNVRHVAGTGVAVIDPFSTT